MTTKKTKPIAKPPTKAQPLRLKVPQIAFAGARYRLVLVEYNEAFNQVLIEERMIDNMGADRWEEKTRFAPADPVTQLIEAFLRERAKL